MARRYRRSGHLLCYWTDRGGVIYNYATAVQVRATDLIWQLLDFCEGWRTEAEIRRRAARGIPATLFLEILQSLVSSTLLEVSDRPRDLREQKMDAWDAWNPSAGFYHTASRQCTWGDRVAHTTKLKAKARRYPMPASVKAQNRNVLALPIVRTTTAVAQVLMDRRTWRQFGKKPVEQKDLSELLRLTSGITHWLTVPELGEVSLTTSPSGGARHPIETYVVLLRVRDVPAGVYRYAPERHELDLVRAGATADELRLLIPKQPWFADAGIVVFFTALFERTQWRYEFPRAYRGVLLEAGHMCQTFLLAATSLGLAPFSTMAIDDARLEALLGLDGISEAVLYAAGAGTRPHTGGRVVMPAGEALPVTRVNVLRDARASCRRS